MIRRVFKPVSNHLYDHNWSIESWWSRVGMTAVSISLKSDQAMSLYNIMAHLTKTFAGPWSANESVNPDSVVFPCAQYCALRLWYAQFTTKTYIFDTPQLPWVRDMSFCKVAHALAPCIFRWPGTYRQTSNISHSLDIRLFSEQRR